ncbi:DAK2 domain-containing protein [Salibacterium salarium]|uniref:DAK2 domain-containing protein n=1 Tax=Salibacterium salarium TaxID=284579 RepID=A0A428MZ04_9BACI|nr:DAK2 domain-containing protein [Salibacterium salarium]RSL31269.1 DAK2 domain-containing protein [Salibacterium salarium]
MTETKVDGKQLALMFQEGAAVLGKNVKKVDALNVFPVPDGDTGTNMNLTITSGVKEVHASDQSHAGQVAKSFSKGLLMGARGNSGVILSQLFRGFSKAVEKKQELTVADLEEALEEGVKTAYKAVMKPVEGTILTVAKEAATQNAVSNDEAPVEWMRSVLHNAEASLKKTPDLLPVLKEVGVVDSGGQGLVYIYEGMLQALLGKTTKQEEESSAPSLDDLVKVEHHQNAQSRLSTEDIEYGYCTEIMVKFDKEKLLHNVYDENAFKSELERLGDSLLVVSDEDLIKVHIHAEYPGEVLSKAQTYGSLIHVKIDNMREQHQALTETESNEPQPNPKSSSQNDKNPASYGFVTVSTGDGVEALFQGLGANQVVAGGQTMNPSTEDIVNAINNVHANHIFVLPNNGNIVMAAEQAAKVSGNHVYVIPTKSVPQGLSAMFAFEEERSPEENEDAMDEARKQVKTGQVTYAVRDTMMEGLEIKKGDYMGLAEKDIVASGPTMEKVTMELLANLIDDDDEIVTLIRGEDVDKSMESAVSTYMEEAFPDIELETHEGGQPLYSYIIAVE